MIDTLIPPELNQTSHPISAHRIIISLSLDLLSCSEEPLSNYSGAGKDS